MVVYIEGYEFFNKKIEEMQNQIKIAEEEADFINEKISKLNKDILLREKGVEEEGNVRRRRILLNILKDKQETRAVFCFDLEKLKTVIVIDQAELYVYTLAQRQLKWGGPKADYP